MFHLDNEPDSHQRSGKGDQLSIPPVNHSQQESNNQRANYCRERPSNRMDPQSLARREGACCTRMEVARDARQHHHFPQKQA